MTNGSPQAVVIERYGLEVVVDYPPMFAEIDGVFGVKGKDVLYAWGSRVYNPNGVVIPGQLWAHEAAHGVRQGYTESAIRDWWRRYLDDPRFRLSEEVPAHVAEYRWFVAHGTRMERRSALKVVGARLSAKLYGGLVTAVEARRILEDS